MLASHRHNLHKNQSRLAIKTAEKISLVLEDSVYLRSFAYVDFRQ